MKIVVAMDSFKGSISSVDACRAVAEVIQERRPGAAVVIKPMADGGEGTARAMMAAAGGEWIPRRVMGPLEAMRVDAGFAWWEEDRTALVEMAVASGMELLRPGQLNPLETTTYGTGELIGAAAEHGAKKILLAVGGSATVDGGTGAAAALGWSFLDEQGKNVPLGGGGLSQIRRIGKPASMNLPALETLCDVDNPLCGRHGAARVYGPQKGATPEMVEQLESGLSHLADLVKRFSGKDISDVPGAGAAGGLAAGAIAFMNSRLVSGIETVMGRSNLAAELGGADLVITGEGCLDEQSLRGKVVAGVCRLAKLLNVPAVVIAGHIMVDRKDYARLGIVDSFACKSDKMTLEYAMKNASQLLRRAAADCVNKHMPN